MIWILFLAMLMPIKEEVEFSNLFTEATLPNGLVLDRISDRTTVSCASTGLVAYSKAILVKKGKLERNSTRDLIKKGFDNTIKNNPESNNGWLYHFTDENGIAKPYSEVSTIDTVLFYLGHLKAAETLQDEVFIAKIRDHISKINYSMVMRDNYFLHGFYNQNGSIIYINELWDDYNEGVLIYRLFSMDFKPIIVSYDLPLFVYYYPLCFFNDQEYVDELKNAVSFQKNKFGYIGITACDGPEGYQIGDPDVVSPLSLYAASKFSDLAKRELENISHYRLVPSFSKSSNWVALDKTLIDFASCYICISN